jgi:hypothetical protein
VLALAPILDLESQPAELKNASPVLRDPKCQDRRQRYPFAPGIDQELQYPAALGGAGFDGWC